MTNELPLMDAELIGFETSVYTVPYVKYCESSMMVGVALEIVVDMLDAVEFVKNGVAGGGSSLIWTVKDFVDVPAVLIPLITMLYEAPLYAPMIDNVELVVELVAVLVVTSSEAELWGLEVSVYDEVYIQYRLRSTITGVVDVRAGRIRVAAPISIGSGGVSVMIMDNVSIDVPVIFVADTRTSYVTSRKAP